MAWSSGSRPPSARAADANATRQALGLALRLGSPRAYQEVWCCPARQTAERHAPIECTPPEQDSLRRSQDSAAMAEGAWLRGDRLRGALRRWVVGGNPLLPPSARRGVAALVGMVAMLTLAPVARADLFMRFEQASARIGERVAIRSYGSYPKVRGVRVYFVPSATRACGDEPALDGPAARRRDHRSRTSEARHERCRACIVPDPAGTARQLHDRILVHPVRTASRSVLHERATGNPMDRHSVASAARHG